MEVGITQDISTCLSLSCRLSFQPSLSTSSFDSMISVSLSPLCIFIHISYPTPSGLPHPPGCPLSLAAAACTRLWFAVVPAHPAEAHPQPLLPPISSCCGRNVALGRCHVSIIYLPLLHCFCCRYLPAGLKFTSYI